MSALLERAQITASRILVCSSDATLRQRLSDHLFEDMAVQAIVSVEQAAPFLKEGSFDICITDGVHDAQKLGEFARAHGLVTQIIALVRDGSAPLETDPAFDILEVPYSSPALPQVIRLAAVRGQLLGENRRLKRQLSHHALRQIIGQSPVVQTLRHKIHQAAENHVPVLISGEVGTGTDLVAQAIHDSGPRAHRPFITLRCAVLTAIGLERELFGTRNSETAGDAVLMPGRLGLAERGTLFLQDVDAIPLTVQSALVGVLNSRLFNPQQAEGVHGPNVRVIAATHADLAHLVEKKLFRKDLYARLKFLSITTPPLRERPDDIAPLTEHFLQQFALREGRPMKRITLDTIETLKAYHWPGNIQELENVLERGCAIDGGPKLTVDIIRPWLCVPANDPGTASHGLALRDMERKLIESTFARFEGNRERTAQALRIGLRTLSGKLREYGYPPRGGPGSNQAPISRAA